MTYFVTIDFPVTIPETISRPFLGSSSLAVANRRNKLHTQLTKIIPEIADIPRVGAGKILVLKPAVNNFAPAV